MSLHIGSFVSRSTEGRFDAFFSRINGNEVFAINCEGCIFIVVKSVLVSSHLFALLKYFRGLSNEGKNVNGILLNTQAGSDYYRGGE
jgi:hypothetical protein